MNFVQKNNKTYTENGNKNEQQPNKKGIGYSSPKQNKDTHGTQKIKRKKKTSQAKTERKCEISYSK